MKVTFRTIMAAATGAVIATTPTLAAPTSPPRSGTIAVVAADGDQADAAMSAIAREAVMTALGDKGFTILDDRDHAAYIAEVVADRSNVGTSVTRKRGEAPSVMGGGVNIPLKANGTTLVAMQRVAIEVRIHKRGDTATLWHGAAVTVRSGEPSPTLAVQLSQTALNAYPTIVDTAISVP
ncbi:hypothetical protein QP166_07155 [Sphingomonas sp. LR60]|uniref:hypothetical protein n=1 Tax=Sphingomonas sp. LR60 TaxID=3050233 RepID=UPI002FE3AA3F